MVKYGNNIAAERARAGIRRADLAEATGFTIHQLRSWEEGKAQMNGEQIIALARFFNVSSDFLLGLSEYRLPVPNIVLAGIPIQPDVYDAEPKEV